MTIEEAIEVLKANYPDKCYEQLCEAVEMAIKSFEAWKKVKEEIKFIQEAEIQVYGKANWNFSGKCLDVINKHLAEVSE